MSKLLALDISSRSTGWAIFEDAKLVTCGVIKINPKNGWGFRLSLFREALSDIIKTHQPDEVIIEDIYKGPSIIAFRVLAMFHGVAYCVVNDMLHAEPTTYKVMEIRKALSALSGKDIKCKTKEQAFFIINSSLKLKLGFTEGNDIADACALAYGHYYYNKIEPHVKVRFNQAKYAKIGAENGSVQGTRTKANRVKRRSKKGVQKASKKVSSRSKSKRS